MPLELICFQNCLVLPVPCLSGNTRNYLSQTKFDNHENSSTCLDWSPMLIIINACGHANAHLHAKCIKTALRGIFLDFRTQYLKILDYRQLLEKGQIFKALGMFFPCLTKLWQFSKSWTYLIKKRGKFPPYFKIFTLFQIRRKFHKTVRSDFKIWWKFTPCSQSHCRLI